jgi:hypothetical protein
VARGAPDRSFDRAHHSAADTEIVKLEGRIGRSSAVSMATSSPLELIPREQLRTST